MTFEVQRHATHESCLAQKRSEHANQLSAFLVNRGGIKIVNRLISIWLHRMGSGPRIFPELSVAEH